MGKYGGEYEDSNYVVLLPNRSRLCSQLYLTKVHDISVVGTPLLPPSATAGRSTATIFFAGNKNNAAGVVIQGKEKENGGGIRGRTRMACPTMPGMYLVASGKDFCWIKVRIGRSSSVAKSASLFLGWEKKDTGVEWSTIPSLSFFPLPIIIFCRAAGILGLPRWLVHSFRS